MCSTSSHWAALGPAPSPTAPTVHLDADASELIQACNGATATHTGTQEVHVIHRYTQGKANRHREAYKHAHSCACSRGARVAHSAAARSAPIQPYRRGPTPRCSSKELAVMQGSPRHRSLSHCPTQSPVQRPQQATAGRSSHQHAVVKCTSITLALRNLV